MIHWNDLRTCLFIHQQLVLTKACIAQRWHSCYLPSCPGLDFSLDVAELNWRHCLESAQRLDTVSWTRLVLTCGKLQQKNSTFTVISYSTYYLSLHSSYYRKYKNLARSTNQQRMKVFIGFWCLTETGTSNRSHHLCCKILWLFLVWENKIADLCKKNWSQMK